MIDLLWKAIICNWFVKCMRDISFFIFQKKKKKKMIIDSIWSNGRFGCEDQSRSLRVPLFGDCASF